ncbi:hypothetical protein JCM19235_3487 [Vibrio maritimus]|uniref:Uncharacterized protein n=1 Tax=Vibrio maritimus TaxID=990268 RepID=A0A090RYI4_9VIBR|nr:hypothetical protein JCM19235_3487 [Vibrio maritimus]
MFQKNKLDQDHNSLSLLYYKSLDLVMMSSSKYVEVDSHIV